MQGGFCDVSMGAGRIFTLGAEFSADFTAVSREAGGWPGFGGGIESASLAAAEALGTAMKGAKDFSVESYVSGILTPIGEIRKLIRCHRYWLIQACKPL